MNPRYRILVVDDEPEVLRMLTMLLELDGHIVHASSDGYFALSAYWDFRPNIVITDLEMPNLDGVDLIKEIRQFDDGVAIILITGHELSRTAELDPFEVSEVLLKPCHPNDILEAVKKAAIGVRKGAGFVPVGANAEGEVQEADVSVEEEEAFVDASAADQTHPAEATARVATQPMPAMQQLAALRATQAKAGEPLGQAAPEPAAPVAKPPPVAPPSARPAMPKVARPAHMTPPSATPAKTVVKAPTGVIPASVSTATPEGAEAGAAGGEGAPGRAPTFSEAAARLKERIRKRRQGEKFQANQRAQINLFNSILGIKK